MTDLEAFRILGVPAGSSIDEIRDEYRDLVRAWHPDRFGDDPRLREKAERRLQAINAAYEHLETRPAGHVSPTDAVDVEPPDPATGPRSDAEARPAWDPLWIGAACAALGAIVGVGLTLAMLPDRPLSDEAPTAATLESAPRVDPSRSAAAVPQATGAEVPDPRLVNDPSRPESATELLTPFRPGMGTLSVENLLDRDAVIVLERAGTQERALFVRSGEKAAAFDVAPGAYRILVAHGYRWREGRFTMEAAYRAFEQPAEFVERPAPDGTDYTRLSLSLQGEGGDTLSTSAVGPFTLRAAP
jgi:hypothetical protein